MSIQTDQSGPRVIDHATMVGALVKSGAVINLELTDSSVDLWHGATGVAGETGEFLDAILKGFGYGRGLDKENVVEELGDIEFYLEQVRQNLGIDRKVTIEANTGIPADSAVFVAAALAVAGCDLLDLVKKVAVYNKPVPTDDMIGALSAIERNLSSIRAFLSITREATLAANIYKLAEGPNARYKGGYSDQAAQDRADKSVH